VVFIEKVDRIELRDDRSTVQKNDAPYQLLNNMPLFDRLLLYSPAGLVSAQVDR
jgi:hypothetical protein